ncbi:FAD-dependent monooxygenase [Piscinibacter sakaiensis]|uniref:2-octaprenyl-3-methyl-6-methoxy-1,4-benzoquinol hydroxylase n=1 Tax=Piscinibacter sakaiensis TaxID=1547922 RepID=A0A0K8P0X4_PISS1|nr:FAD-dependent monooxygenase [Piscinibacter sakaiensis]GAP36312.1 2-octaprenyl-3-methyl-6-methoxy-1,4-benzoquinol hydroxylase [Piscinibacter sakaiensis]
MSGKVEVCIRGAGIVGGSLALALARQGLRVELVGPLAAPAAAGAADVRAYALNAASVGLLQALRVWDALPADAATPVRRMQIEGDEAGARLAFSAWQQRVGELAWIVDAAALEAALAEALRYAPHVERRAEARPGPAPALTAVCEGRASASRDALGVPMAQHDYGHRAIAARLVADRPHQGTARQWFRAPDVLALLPFDRPQPGRSYGLVWSLPDAEAAALLALDEAAFVERLQAACGEAAGGLALASPRQSWPLSLARAERWCGEGWVLLGDAAHRVHPLAGQGLNLGLADVEALARVLAGREPWRSPGDARLLRRFARERSGPTRAMAGVTDGLLQLFAHPHPAVRLLRNQGLRWVDRLGPAKRWLADQALDGR